MTPRKYPQNLKTPPPKILIFLKTPKNIEIQNFEPQKWTFYVSVKISEYPLGMQVKSIAEYSWGAFCNTFNLHLAFVFLNGLCWVYLRVAVLGRFYCIFLGPTIDNNITQTIC